MLPEFTSEGAAWTLANAGGTRRNHRQTQPRLRLGQLRHVQGDAQGSRYFLLILDEDFELERITEPARSTFDAVRAKLLFESDIFWARASIGEEVLQVWLETYQVSRNFRKRGIVELELP